MINHKALCKRFVTNGNTSGTISYTISAEGPMSSVTILRLDCPVV